MVVLGIETSCDETAASVVENGRILSSIVSSSVHLHRKYGGVIPEVASRFHIEYINKVTRKALKAAGKRVGNPDCIAVTDSPGLLGSLLAGLSFARALSYALNKPLVSVNHLHAHLFANFLVKDAQKPVFPFVGVVVSGGHTNIFICNSFEDLNIIGKTKDDAVGEAFDKVAKILGIGYPGGPEIEKFARKFSGKSPIAFPRVYLDKDSFDFSLSGIKTAVLYHVRNRKMSKRDISRVSWSFQEAVFDVLAGKVIKACRKFDIKRVVMGGGVISNMTLRAKLKQACRNMGYVLHYPPPGLCVDNAAMVGGLGEIIAKRGGTNDEEKERRGTEGKDSGRGCQHARDVNL